MLLHETTDAVSGLKHSLSLRAGPAEQTSFATWH